ncbi:domain of Kin17 curved DNA-binding protein-domain-containing protein [Emericellopsis atlantica]|uniref:Domain of Kin17 curved DNA-binding protein-domain-containing protein n=1 Tax=Emericellopsis atlantica TaxID=2614577 RepID=A0A9P8CQF3_9HYPO|nr:domain of Kin17 curved DNA-binding protein-domain-containing protein [Emericellopsis atlantica]KAG9255252.1 domain of Kin17 curved DNA-binding protein-domain-containing protein [Emericellopsis atlantica]
MPKAEVGSTKHLSNKLKSKGLQRLRWYCQVCEKQCRDANGFKMHTQSESHVRQMLVVGEDPRKFINDFSNQFQRDFLTLLRTGHGEKEVQINRFYQEYIANKEHVHMNSTKWPSLTEFAKHLGREGICRVEENEKGIHIAWIDNSPEALRRRNALKRKEAEDQGNEEVEQRMIREQIKRAQANARHDKDEERDAAERELKRQEGEKITLSFGGGAKSTPKTESSNPTVEEHTPEASGQDAAPKEPELPQQEEEKAPAKPAGFGGVSMKMGGKPQTKNVFAQAKKNALSGGKKGGFIDQPKKMSEAERIMKEEMERKRSRGSGGFSMPAPKKQRSS